MHARPRIRPATGPTTARPLPRRGDIHEHQGATETECRGDGPARSSFSLASVTTTAGSDRSKARAAGYRWSQTASRRWRFVSDNDATGGRGPLRSSLHFDGFRRGAHVPVLWPVRTGGVAGPTPDIYICPDCIRLAAEILNEQDAPRETSDT